eukprot:277886_1
MMIQALTFLVLIAGLRLSLAQLIHPSDMVIGRWKVSLNRRDTSLFESMIFPKQQEKEVGEIQIYSRFNAKGRTLKKMKRRLECDLIFDADGSFTLVPPNDEDESPASKKRGSTCTAIRSPLRGEWHLRPNPYCVTDRHYDELRLRSIPKVKSYQDEMGPRGPEDDSSPSLSPSASPSPSPSRQKEQITMEMQCKLWGRYGSNTIRHFLKRPRGKDAGRMVKGQLSIVKIVSDDDANEDEIDILDASTRRVLCATFRGSRIPTSE